MSSRYIFLFALFFSLSCKTRIDREEMDNAKWFYYACAMEEKAYSSGGNEINPLSCYIKLNTIKRYGVDTTRYYFSLYLKDTLTVCYLKPYGLIGVLSVKNRLYTPIYHSIIFDKETDSLTAKEMNARNSSLLQRVLGSSEGVNPWLLTEAERRRND
ncbi:MAG TPA: hypothetical protein VGM41_16450 [Chitinophagaceae bacterium]|jgi:hypothetical protein